MLFTEIGYVKIVQLLCAGFTLGVLFMAVAVQYRWGTLCAL